MPTPKKHKVKCLYCGEEFFWEDTPHVKIKTRYAHEECAKRVENQKTEEEKEHEALVAYICKLFNISKLNAKLNSQVKDLVEKKGYSYKGIRKSLQYWFEIKGNSIEKSNGGIGIVPYIYDQAHAYWLSIWEAQQRNKQNIVAETVVPIREVRIPSPERKPMKVIRRLFTFLEEDGEAQ